MRQLLVPELIETVDALRRRLWPASSPSGSPLGLVPTMGALHDGHAALIGRARGECATVAVSIFVNPLQFDRPDDLARYPRTLEHDLEMCRQLGVDVVFAPSASEMYPEPPECTVSVGRLADHLCGKFRPGHFAGVATVVLKLFEIVRPDRAYFGEKDAQQLAIIKRLVSDFNLPISIVEVPTVREADGLAMSSRNQRLDANERLLAPALYRALKEAERLVHDGHRDAAEICRLAAATLPASSALRLEYLELVNPATMQPVSEVAAPVRAAAALWVGTTRLIDNLIVDPRSSDVDRQRDVDLVRAATASEADALAALINRAFVVEAFFKIGDRTSSAEIVRLMESGGEFLIVEGRDGSESGTAQGSAGPAGCVYLRCEGERAYFGMLSIDPPFQGRGLGKLLIAAAESRARERGCQVMDIHIVNLREELPGYYRRLGYSERATLPFSDPESASRPCHFIVMSKPLIESET